MAVLRTALHPFIVTKFNKIASVIFKHHLAVSIARLTAFAASSGNSRRASASTVPSQFRIARY
jgi:hypothetical protein